MSGAEWRPPAADDRIASLDLVRGVAVIGIAFMNVAAFTMPFAAYDDPRAWGGHTLADHLVWAFDFVFVDGKMRALFSALFGASMLLVVERAGAAGRNGLAVHYRRMAWLLVIGLLHGTLIWFGDILALYAIIGTLAVLARRMSAHELVVLALLCLVLPVMWDGMAWAEGARITVDHAAVAADLALHRSGWLAITADRLQTQAGVLGHELGGNGIETLGLMLAGMAAYRSGLLTGAWGRHRLRRLACWSLVLGLPPLVATALLLWRSGFDGRLLYGAVFVVGALCRPAVAFGYAALLVGWSAGTSSALTLRLAAAGRMALTNYLLSSLLGTTLAYGYGLDRFGRLDRVEQMLFAASIGVLIAMWSKPWLARYRYGPAEWAWRSLARCAPQPMRRRSASQASAMRRTARSW